MPVRGAAFQRKKSWSFELSIPGHSLVSQASPINLCLAGQVLQFSAPSSVLPCSPAISPKPCGTSTWWTSLRAYGCPSVPFQPTWPRERMAAMSSLNPGPELPVWPISHSSHNALHLDSSWHLIFIELPFPGQLGVTLWCRVNCPLLLAWHCNWGTTSWLNTCSVNSQLHDGLKSHPSPWPWAQQAQLFNITMKLAKCHSNAK